MRPDEADCFELDGRISVIIPAYNEEEGIGETVRRLKAAYPEVEILVVDDGSSDATVARAMETPGVQIVSHPRNRGYGAALKTGIRRCKGTYVAWYDADGQHRPEDLRRVVLPVLEGRHDLVIGVRGRDSASQADRVVGKLILKWVAEGLSGERIPDLNSGLRCFRREMLIRYLHLLPDGFSASTTSTLLAIKRGYRVGHEPIRTLDRVGDSTVKVLNDGLSTLRLILRLIVLFEAFKVFGILGISLIVPGFVYGLAVALLYGRGVPTLAGTAVLAGLLTLFIGIVADQVAELRKERFEDPVEKP